jgi:uncharacterized protein
MVVFKPLELEDRELFQKYLRGYNFNTYEYSFSTLYLWRKLCSVEYAIIAGALVVKKTERNVGTYFMQPIGYTKENIKEVINILIEMKRRDRNIKCLFRDIEEPFIDELRELFSQEICLCEDVNNFDYIYNREELMTLRGNRFHKKRNHYNQFIATYNFEARDLLEDGVINDCRIFAEEWTEGREKITSQLEHELEGINDVLSNIKQLNLQGMAVYIDGKIAGFTIGEKVNGKMAIIHIEKANAEYRGIYAYVNKTFIERYFNDVTFINREEDLGVEGLREAKKSYHPVKLEKKFIVNVGYMCGEFILTSA